MYSVWGLIFRAQRTSRIILFCVDGFNVVPTETVLLVCNTAGSAVVVPSFLEKSAFLMF